MLEHPKRLAAGAGDDLGEAVMVAQIDEQHAAMIALAMHPARQFHPRADVAFAELAAIVGTVGVHPERAFEQNSWGKECARALRVSEGALSSGVAPL
jgi:hypothetical protein